MTNQEVQARYDVIFQGREYLCIHGANHERKPAPPIPRSIAAATVTNHELNRRRIASAMPGTMRELEARTGFRRHVIYAALSHFSRKRQLISDGRRPVLYTLTSQHALAEGK